MLSWQDHWGHTSSSPGQAGSSRLLCNLVRGASRDWSGRSHFPLVGGLKHIDPHDLPVVLSVGARKLSGTGSLMDVPLDQVVPLKLRIWCKLWTTATRSSWSAMTCSMSL